MMIEIENWMAQLTDKLKACFTDRLLFVGLQGSYQRQEADNESDIDVVVIMDTVTMDDLVAYRKLLLTMPDNEKACGFISGRQELMNWPKHELFQFGRDTRPYYGDLDGLLPQIDRQDVIDSVKIAASGLYHICCHTAVHDSANKDALKAIYKSAFFILQAVYYLRHNDYIGSKKQLHSLLEADEREILDINMNWKSRSADIDSKEDACFDLMLRWSKGVLNDE